MYYTNSYSTDNQQLNYSCNSCNSWLEIIKIVSLFEDFGQLLLQLLPFVIDISVLFVR